MKIRVHALRFNYLWVLVVVVLFPQLSPMHVIHLAQLGRCTAGLRPPKKMHDRTNTTKQARRFGWKPSGASLRILLRVAAKYENVFEQFQERRKNPDTACKTS